MRTVSRTPSILSIALVVAIAACGAREAPPRSAEQRPLIAFFQDLSIEDPLDLVSPSFLSLETGLRAAFERGVDAAPIPVQFDMDDDAATALDAARTVAADHAYVAVVVAPFWAIPDEVATVLADAGLPIISLSDAPRPSVPGLVWRGFVPPSPAQAEALSSLAAAATEGGTVCVVVRETAPQAAQELALAVRARLDERGTGRDPDDLTGCGSVVWTEGPAGAAELRRSLPTATPLFVAAASKSAAFLDASPASDGTVAVCPCVEVTTATGIQARRFVHDYQAATGLAPGVFAAEAWDVATLLGRIAATDEGDRGVRAAYLAQVNELTRDRGVIGEIVFDVRGELLGRAGTAHASVAAGRRWLPLP